MATSTRVAPEMTTPTRGTGSGLLKFTLWVGLIDAFAFGALILFAPAFVVETLAEMAVFSYGAFRWSGGVLLALSLGGFYVLRNPRGQMPMFTMLATASLLSGAGFLWSWLADEYDGTTWFLVAVLIGTLGLSALQWFTRFRAKDILA